VVVPWEGVRGAVAIADETAAVVIRRLSAGSSQRSAVKMPWSVVRDSLKSGCFVS
jgi:hypothetical protein